MAPPSDADAALNLSVRRRGAMQPHQASHAGHSFCAYRARPGRAGAASKERSIEWTRLDARSTSLASAHGEHGAHRLNERFTPCRSGGGHKPHLSPDSRALMLALSVDVLPHAHALRCARPCVKPPPPHTLSAAHAIRRASRQHARIATHSACRDSAVQNSGHYGGTTGVFSLMPVRAWSTSPYPQALPARLMTRTSRCVACSRAGDASLDSGPW